MPNHLIQVVLYQWKPTTTPARINYHLTEIRALVGKVDGLLSVTGGHRDACYNHPADPSLNYEDILILTWADKTAYGKWGTHPEHDRLAPGLVADITRLTSYTYIGE
jgi:hypothetical protein